MDLFIPINDDKTLNIGTHNITFTRNGYTYLFGAVTGSGNIVYTPTSDSAELNINGGMSGFTGSITINKGISYVGSTNCNGNGLDGAQVITVNGDGRLIFRCTTIANIGVPIILNGNGPDPFVSNDANWSSTTYFPALSIRGTNPTSKITVVIESVTLGANSTFGAINYTSSSTITITNMTKNGHTLKPVPGSNGKLIIDGAEVASEFNKVFDKYNDDNYTGPYSVWDKEYYIVSGKQPKLVINVLDGGILGGTGTVNNVTIESGGTIAPGMSPGTITVANIDWKSGGIYEFEVGKNGADKIVAKGTVKLGNGTLSTKRYQKYLPKVGTTYVIIDNDGTDKITGTFKNLPEGASFTSDGVVYQISYKGGSGNDVTLKVKAIPGAPNTGFGMLKNNPLLTLALTTFAAGIILAIAKRRKSVTKA